MLIHRIIFFNSKWKLYNNETQNKINKISFPNQISQVDLLQNLKQYCQSIIILEKFKIFFVILEQKNKASIVIVKLKNMIWDLIIKLYKLIKLIKIKLK